MTTRSFVPFDSLWQMPIDVPYSLLVRDGDDAWSCGQLALDGDSNVLAANDLAAQSSLVAGYIAQVLRREVDAFAGPTVDDRFDWHSVEAPSHELGPAVDSIATDGLLTAHWFVPEAQLTDVAADLGARGLVHDAGAVISAGPEAAPLRGSLLRMSDGSCAEQHSTTDGVRLTSRQAEGIGWIAARSTDTSAGLVEQTEQIMDAIAASLDQQGLGFNAVVKSTTLYAGGSSAAELHDNMAVRNRRYEKPGPASTGLPVFGFADPATLVTVDVTYLSNPKQQGVSV